MLRYSSLLCIICMHLWAFSEGVIVEFAEEKKDYILGTNMGTNKCEFDYNNTKYFYKGKKEQSLPKNTEVITECNLIFRNISSDYSGAWKITGGKEVKDYMLFVVNKKIRQSVEPSVVKQAVNKSVIFRLSGDEGDIEHCLLIQKDVEYYNITANNNKGYLEPRSNCEVKMNIQSSSYGAWMLAKFVKGGTVYYGEFRITIDNNKNDGEIIKEEEHETILGTQNYKITLGEYVMNCELTDPFNRTRISASTDCSYSISDITFNDAGTWTMYYHQNNDHTTYIKKYKLIVYEPRVQTKIIYNENSIHLLCYMKYDTSTQFCHFEHPNGTMFVMYSIIGNERYESYTNSSDPSESKDCGITINSPKNFDYGVWKCSMKITKPQTQVGSILHVKTQSADRNKIHVKNTNIYVIHNNTFELSCNVNEIIKNCWLESPNGSVFLINDKNEYSDFKYAGRGFSMGDCGAIIENATDDYHGKWKCQMQLENNKRLEAKLNVIVTKSAVIAKQDKIIYTGSPITMSCVVIPSETLDFDVCRWIKPDGNGIHYESDQRYRLESSPRECKLHVADEDIKGGWTCVLQSNFRQQEVYSASIQVYSKSSRNSLTIILSSVLCIVFLILCITFYLNRKRILRIAKVSNVELK